MHTICVGWSCARMKKNETSMMIQTCLCVMSSVFFFFFFSSAKYAKIVKSWLWISKHQTDKSSIHIHRLGFCWFTHRTVAMQLVFGFFGLFYFFIPFCMTDIPFHSYSSITQMNVILVDNTWNNKFRMCSNGKKLSISIAYFPLCAKLDLSNQ